MTKESGIIFDYGGVVQKFNYEDFIKQMADKLNIKKDNLRLELKTYLPQLRTNKMSEKQFLNKLSDSGYSFPANIDATSLFQLTYTKGRSGGYYEEVVQSIKNINAPLYVASGTIPAHAQWNREKDGYRWFDKVFLSCEIGYMKPRNNFYNYILNNVDNEADNLLYIDDHVSNVKAAEQHGFATFMHSSANDEINELINKINEHGITT